MVQRLAIHASSGPTQWPAYIARSSGCTVHRDAKPVVRPGTSAGNQTIPTGLLDNVVAFEAAADDFNIDVQRYKRLLQPAQYRDALSQNSDELYRLAQVLHDQLQQQRDIGQAKQTAQQLVTVWQQLAVQLNEISQRGLSQARTEALYESYRQMQQQLAPMASSLLQ